MEADISQIKLLLWVILGLNVAFIVANVLCRIVGCGERSSSDYADLWERGKLDELIVKTGARLKSHPRDIDALYFRARTLLATGQDQAARITIDQLLLVEPRLRGVALAWLETPQNGS